MLYWYVPMAGNETPLIGKCIDTHIVYTDLSVLFSHLLRGVSAADTSTRNQRNSGPRSETAAKSTAEVALHMQQHVVGKGVLRS